MEYDFTKEPGRRLLNRPVRHDGIPLLSIVTPFYNAGEYFEQTCNCVLNQTFPYYEWIIIDDGSTDTASLALLERLAATDARIQVLHRKNGGQSAARNTGIRNSRTEIIVPLDADDLIEPTFLEVLWFALEKNPDAAWSYTDSVGFGAQQYLWRQPFSAARMKTENILVCTAAIRKSWLERVGGYAESRERYDEDWELWLRLLALGAEPLHLGGWLFWYRRRADGAQQAVQKDAVLSRHSLERVRSAAARVDESVRAKEYPSPGVTGRYAAPKVSDWERKLFPTHEKTHVLLLLPWMVMGGADGFNLDVCARLDKNRFELGIITTQQAENVWQQRFAEHLTDIFNLPEFLDVEHWAEFIGYYIKSREVDVVFLSNSYYGYSLVPWLRTEFPALAIADYVHMEEWYWRNGGHARCSGVMGAALDKTLCCCERTRRVMIEHFSRAPESVETLYIGVDAEKNDPARVRAGSAKAQLGIARDRPMILFPCRIHAQKRPFLMLEIAKRLPELAFAVVGDGPELEALRDAVKHGGLEQTVYFAGRQADMRPWYKDAVLTLICSLKEGVALTAYESLSMSVPVISSDVGGQAELIDSTVGRLVPLLQSEEADLENRTYSEEEISLYVDALRELLSDRAAYEAMRTTCRRRIEEGFSARLMAERLSQVLTELAKRSDARRAQSAAMQPFAPLFGELATLYGEIEGYEAAYKAGFSDTKSELLRLANSKWGRRAIRLAFKLRLNKLF